MDFYEILAVPRNADATDIKKAFRRLALELHPDTEGGAGCSARFASVCEAYDVLSNSRTKGTYDLHGMAALKAPEPDGCGYNFDVQFGPSKVFARFFGTSNPYEAIGALAEHFEQLSSQPKPAPGRASECELVVPLEDIFHGCTRTVRHTRSLTTLQDDGSPQAVTEERTLLVSIAPGTPDGTRYVFEGEGDVGPGSPAGPVVLILAAAPHTTYERRGSDLATCVQLPLLQALVGGVVSLRTLDARLLSVPLESIVAPGHMMRIPGEGMPLIGGGRGDLILRCQLVFPPTLSQEQKLLLRAALLLPARPSAAQGRALRAFEGAFRDASTGWSSGVAASASSDGAQQ